MAAVQESRALRQDVRKTTSVERADAFIDLDVTQHTWPSGYVNVRVRLDLKHAAALHKQLGAAIKSARKWEAREKAALKRNTEKRRRGRVEAAPGA